MLWTIAVILLVLWLIGAVVEHLGGLIHVVLVAAVIVFVVRLVRGRA